jgi:hypothetical protein
MWKMSVIVSFLSLVVSCAVGRSYKDVCYEEPYYNLLNCNYKNRLPADIYETRMAEM